MLGQIGCIHCSSRIDIVLVISAESDFLSNCMSFHTGIKISTNTAIRMDKTQVLKQDDFTLFPVNFE